jgi:hypothetical protein
MKFLKNIILCAFMAVSVAGVSTTAFAENDPGRVTYKPADAINNVVAKLKEAQAAIAAGKTDDEVMELVKAAKNLTKEINANDKVDRGNAKAKIHIGKAIGMLKEKDQKMANEHITAAIPEFEALKSLI